jgi:retinol dehydrogenase-14
MSTSHALDGRICLVTGASSGIGEATAVGLAERGATVVLVCRNRDTGQAAREEVVARSGHPAVDLLVADLSSQQAVRSLAAEFRSRYARLHVLVNNAAVNLTDRTLTVDRLETTFAVNHLAPYLLTYLLLDPLRAGAPSRVVNVTSAAHQAAIDFDNLQGEKSFNGRLAYVRSKLANIHFTYELAARLAGSEVTVNCVDPGVVATQLGRDFRGVWRLLLNVMWPFLASPERGAETSIYAAAAPELEGVSGRYLVNSRLGESSRVTGDAAVRRRLWEVSARLTGVPPDWGLGPPAGAPGV